MIEFGATLRAAREAKGLTPAQLAQTTHLMAQQIEALENEDFSKIAAPIYGRGFVKLYCEGVGLDPKPMVAEFMEIFSGNRQPAIRMRTPAPAPAPAPAAEPEPEPISEPLPAAPALADISEPSAQPVQDFFLESEVVPARRPAPAASVPPVSAHLSQNDGLLFPQEEIAPAAPTGRKPSRYTTPVPIDDDDGAFRFSLASIPPAAWRILALAVVAGLLLWLVYVCLSSLYHAGMNDGAVSAPAAQESSGTTPTTTTPASPAERSETPISPLYIN